MSLEPKKEVVSFLPNYYKKDVGIWKDLSTAFLGTTDGWEDIAFDFRNGYIFHLANDEQLIFLEGMLKVIGNPTLTREQRIGRLMSKLVKKVTTHEVILTITKQFYPLEEPIIDEEGIDYTVTIIFGNMKVIPEDIGIYRNTILDILQADLDFLVSLDVALSAFTHDELSLQSHNNLESYRQKT